MPSRGGHLSGYNGANTGVKPEKNYPGPRIRLDIIEHRVRRFLLKRFIHRCGIAAVSPGDQKEHRIIAGLARYDPVRLSARHFPRRGGSISPGKPDIRIDQSAPPKEQK